MDGIWKDAVEQYLPLILKRMMPELYDDVDFSQNFTFLDKELRDTIQVSLSDEHHSAKFVDTLVPTSSEVREESMGSTSYRSSR